MDNFANIETEIGDKESYIVSKKNNIIGAKSIFAIIFTFIAFIMTTLTMTPVF